MTSLSTRQCSFGKNVTEGQEMNLSRHRETFSRSIQLELLFDFCAL